MISVHAVLRVHEVLIEKFGGAPGVRDKTLLESSVFRPFGTFESNDLYPTPIEKAAAILESIVQNHPFIDGNKRTGYTLMRLILLSKGLDIEASENEKFRFVIGIAEGKSDFDEIARWIKDHIKAA